MVGQLWFIASLAACAPQVTYENGPAETGPNTFPLVEGTPDQPGPVRRLVVDRGIPRSSRIAVASFANIDDLTEVSSLGRFLSDFFSNGLIAYGYPVQDLEATDEVMLMKYVGAVYRTRQGRLSEGAVAKAITEPNLIAKGVRYVLTGTYTMTRERVVVQVRLIDVTDGKLASSIMLSLARSGMVAELANREAVGRRIEVVGP
jgi:flagellar FlgO protein